MYTLTLTKEEADDIHFVGHRYCWSNALSWVAEGENEFTEAEAWEVRDAFDADTEGGHSMFPMLDSRSELCKKLLKFYEEIV